MKTFTTNPGVRYFETGGPDGLIRVEKGKPFSTDDSRVISILEAHGGDAVTSADSESAEKKGGEQS